MFESASPETINASLYLFSTVSQTLAGAFGFLVAAVTMRLGQYAEEMRKTLKAFRDPDRQTFNQREIDQMRIDELAGAWGAIVETLASKPVVFHHNNADISHRIKAIHYDFSKLVCDAISYEMIRSGLRYSLGITTPTILLALLGLTIVPILGKVAFLLAFMMVADVALAFWAVLSYFSIVVLEFGGRDRVPSWIVKILMRIGPSEGRPGAMKKWSDVQFQYEDGTPIPH